MSATTADLDIAIQMCDRLIALEGDRLVALLFFGSRAKRTAHAESDFDLLAVLEDPVEDHTEEGDRLTNFLLAQLPPYIPDVHVYSVSDFDGCLGVPGYAGYEALHTGRLLHDRDGTVGVQQAQVQSVEYIKASHCR